ncbi:hypothetical protein ADK34_13440 [Streptomyces viridochromogenes]|uniref:Uncharacterized protein n=1 Tax=Streptomyces viridochromogenes TaxID=1938 RepID=A0A0L8KSQ8_STRVR|nr:hypothetical protein ADK34_13440 [Streptomyces viridochromogenes]
MLLPERFEGRLLLSEDLLQPRQAVKGPTFPQRLDRRGELRPQPLALPCPLRKTLFVSGISSAR